MHFALISLALAALISASLGGCPPGNSPDVQAALSVCPGFNTGSNNYDEWGCTVVSEAFACIQARYGRCDNLMGHGFGPIIPTYISVGNYAEQNCIDNNDELYPCSTIRADYENWVIDCPDDDSIKTTPMDNWTCDQFITVMGCKLLTTTHCGSVGSREFETRLYDLATKACS